jgi:Fe-S-cluster containining protein
MSLQGTYGVISRKDALWLACKDKRCCHTTVVVPTGRDLWRLSRELGVPLASFLVCFATPKARRDAFALDHSDQRFRLALAKGPARGRGPAPCIFLLRTRQGHHRCGVFGLRPGVCRTFPCELTEGVVSVGGTECSCRTWGITDVDLSEERAALEHRQRESEEYCGLVEQWNARIVTSSPDVEVTLDDYCDFLLRAYDALTEREQGER